MTSETEQILRSTPTSPNGHAAKRVSFGNDAVKTFVYEKESDITTPIMPRQPFTDPDAPVNRVTVTSDTVRPESPSTISPPHQLEEEPFIRAISPPLHSKKMAEHENPFRPEEQLFHEVDPIVEQYMHKPFLPSRPGSAMNTPVKQQNGNHRTESPTYLQNGLSKEQLMQSEKTPLIAADGASPQPASTTGSSVPQDGSAVTNGGTSTSVAAANSPGSRAEEYQEDLPPAGKVELVHVKRKKCGCCTVQ